MHLENDYKHEIYDEAEGCRTSYWCKPQKLRRRHPELMLNDGPWNTRYVLGHQFSFLLPTISPHLRFVHSPSPHISLCLFASAIRSIHYGQRQLLRRYAHALQCLFLDFCLLSLDLELQRPLLQRSPCMICPSGYCRGISTRSQHVPRSIASITKEAQQTFAGDLNVDVYDTKLTFASCR